MNRAALLAVALVAPGVAGANPMDMYGLGSRSIAMGSGVSADVEDAGANYYNPAGLVRGRSLRLELGYLYAVNSLASNGRDNHVDPVHGVVLGAVVPSRLFGLPFAVGLVLYLPDDRIERSRLLPQSEPRWELYDNRVQRIYFAGNLAIAPTPWLRLGGGFAYMASSRGTLGLSGEIPVLAPNNARLEHTVDADVLSVFYPQAGVQVDVVPRVLTLSAVYRGEYRFNLDLAANLDLTVVGGRLDDPTAVRASGTLGLDAHSVTQFLPQQAVLGAALRPLPTLTLVADLTWVNWSAYINPTASLTYDVHFDRPPGTESIPIPTIPTPPPVEPARFHDTLVPRVGAEWRRAIGPDVLSLRLGYRYDPSPVPDQTGPTNFLDADRHVIGAGAGYALAGRGDLRGTALTLDVHGELGLLPPRAFRKSDPADPVGDVVVGGHVFTMGATLATTF